MSRAHGQGGVGGVWVVIPYKGPVGSKRRLSRLLDDDGRARLSATLFEGVVDAVLGTMMVQRILVIQPADVSIPGHDFPRLEFVPEAPGASPERVDDGADGLNRALSYAQRIATDSGAESLLMLPSDLPMIQTADIEAVVRAATTGDIVISPDRASEGTNALLLRPPASVQPAFGVGSFERHQQRAHAAGRRVTVLRRWGLALDLDTPADVLRLYALAPECRAALTLQQMGVTSEQVAKLGLGDAVSSGA